MKRVAAFLVILIVVIGCTSSTSTQKGGEIRGIAQIDGGPLPGATITLIGPSGPQAVVTGADGAYVFTGLQPGTYKVRAEMDGANTMVTTLKLRAGRTIVSNVPMRFASVAESITVTAAAPGMWSQEYGRYTGAVRAITKSGIEEPTPTFAAIQEHGFHEAAKEPVTTFSIDVDRASYAQVRRFLNEGDKPPADAVRIEELVNYFKYDYPQPRGPEPFSITSEVASCPWDAQHRLVRIGIQGRELEEWKMAPNNLVFLIDVSGSMDTPLSLPLVKDSLFVLVNKLRAEDRVSIVVYAGAAGLVLPPTSGADKPRIIEAIHRLQAGGSTAGGEGIELAYKIAQDNFLKNGNNRVILATDGDFNVGPASPEELEKLIEEKRKSGVFLTVVGVGWGNDATMETLADKGNGNYAFLDDLEEAKKFFSSELTGTLVTIAKDVKVQVEFDPALVASYRQIGYENRALDNKDFTDDKKDAGDLGAGHTVTALYEVVPTRGATAGTLAKLRLRYKEPDGETSRELAASIQDDGRTIFNASPDLKFAAAVAEFGMLLRDSKNRGGASYADVLSLARTSRGVDLDGRRGEFVKLAELAQK
jgi:Ca-activated chloride channel family protein